jgi:hypothetical protein
MLADMKPNLSECVWRRIESGTAHTHAVFQLLPQDCWGAKNGPGDAPRKQPSYLWGAPRAGPEATWEHRRPKISVHKVSVTRL